MSIGAGGTATNRLRQALKQSPEQFTSVLYGSLGQPDIVDGEDTGCGPRELSRGANGIAIRACLDAARESNGSFTCGKCRALKFSLNPQKTTDLLVERDLTRNLRQGMRKVWPDAASHIVRVDTEGEREKLYMAMELITPAVDGIFTLHDLAEWCLGRKRINDIIPTEYEWKSILLQVFGTLSEIRRVVPNFQHNDLHMKNIMLTQWPVDIEQSFRSASGTLYRVEPIRFFVKIIDFGQVTSENPAINTNEGNLIWYRYMNTGGLDFIRMSCALVDRMAAIYNSPANSQILIEEWMDNFFLLCIELIVPDQPQYRNPPYIDRPYKDGGIFGYPGEYPFKNTNESFFRNEVSPRITPEILLDNPYFAEFRA